MDIVIKVTGDALQMKTDSGMKYSQKDELALMNMLWSPEVMMYPEKFVMAAYPWGVQGLPLANKTGPRKWQREELQKIGQHNYDNMCRINRGETPEPYYLAIASGRGPGKTAFISWIADWAMSTRVGSATIVTANTEQQLMSRTWPEIGKWHNLSINSHWFDRTATTLRPSKLLDLSKTGIDTSYYYAQAQLWSEENPDAFAGLHNDYGMVLIMDEACHDDKTEVLTYSGWKFFKDLNKSDTLLTKNPITGVAEYSKPTKLYASARKGKMCLYERKGGNFCVTPNHRMFYRSHSARSNTRRGKWKFGEIQDMTKSRHFIGRTIRWDVEDKDFFVLHELASSKKTFPERRFHLDDFLELLGFYCSEGHLIKGGRRKDGSRLVYGFGLSQREGKVLDAMISLCDRMHLSFSVYELPGKMRQICVFDTQLGRELSKDGHNCLEKRVPRYVQNLSARQIRIFLDAFLDGDGYVKRTSLVYYTSSKGMADDLQEMILKTGKHCCLTTRKLEGQVNDFGTHKGTSSCDGYVISENSGGSEFSFHTHKQQNIDYDGMVYCAEVPPNHLLFTRRNGYCMWSGNSGIPKSIWTVSEGFFTEPIFLRLWIVFSNPRRSEGAFFDCFHKDKKFWHTRHIDSRTVEGLDQAIFQGIIDKHGADSDVARVEVKGQFPRTGSNQLIGYATVEEASNRHIDMEDVAGSAKILTVDVARFGDDLSVVQKRQGLFAHMPIDFAKIDNMVLAGNVANIANEWPADAILIGSGGGQGVIDRLRQLGFNVIEVDEGGSADRKDLYLNKRIEMWDKVDEWLMAGGVIPKHERLMEDLSAPMYDFTPTSNKKLLESVESMKKRGLPSPDFGTALALGFAFEVAPTMGTLHNVKPKIDDQWDVFGIPTPK